MGIKHLRPIVPTKEMRNHFLVVGIPAETHGMERLYFTYAQNKDWCIKVMVYGVSFPTYMLLLEKAIANKYNLEAGDVITFYKPVQPLHSRNLLTEFVKGGETETDQAQLGTSRNDGRGGGDRGKGGGKFGDSTSGGGD
ncbi:hypothetical protein Acr_15g0006110 [Actinidia rufa]|uniref:Uncharacterized protein n=1 Tax=Actinidia rufa TaxID=165716 RepID=A0A7J0FTH5_9ERIC|nr:hypothetical protein Acr_15g0006110 [Actinidia rufa]